MNVENKAKEREKILEVKDLTVTFHTYAGKVQGSSRSKFRPL